MANQVDIKAVITADDKASGVLAKFTNGAIGGLQTGLKTLAVGLAAGGAAVAAFGITSVKAFEESENTLAQLNAVIKSTGGAAGVTAKQATDLAASLQKTTAYSDEAVLSAENLLLTFTSISKKIFPQATKTVLDMSTALGQDTKASAIQLGKALQDPILGVTALRRVGVNFSAAQQDVIKNLVNTGQKAKAQQLILKELNTEFGGSAEAAGKTFAGSLARLSNAFNDLQETVGASIVQAITPFVTKLNDFVTSEGFSAFMVKAKDAVKSLWNAILLLVTGDFKGGIFGFTEDSAEIDFLFNMRDVLIIIGNAIKDIAKAAIDTVGLIITKWGELQAYLKANQLVQAVFADIGRVIDSVYHKITDQLIPKLKELSEQFGPEAKALLKAFGAAFIIALDGAFRALDLVLGKLIDMLNKISEAKAAFDNFIKKDSAANGVELVKKGAPLLLKAMGIPGFAGGVENFGGGLAYVHQGEVLANLPKGTSVLPKSEVDKSISGNSTVNITIQSGAFMGTQSDARKLAMQVYESLKDVAGSKSMSVSELMGS